MTKANRSEMEPVVVLTRLQAFSRSRNATPPKKRKVKGRKSRFERRKRWYTARTRTHPDEHDGEFKGWNNAESEVSDESGVWHLGFQSWEENLSISRMKQAQIDEDMVKFPTKVTSIGAQENSVFIFNVISTPRRSVRVLGLCDGIGSGRLLLSMLDIHVDVFFSTEIDPQALTVQRHRFPGKLIALGCMKQLTPEFLDALGRIDLVLASPPCQDVSLANPARKGFNNSQSTAFLTLDCAKIIKYLQKKMYNHQVPFFFLMEQTAHMSLSSRARIEEAIGTSPKMICASAYKPMLRRRYYYTNLPGASDVEAKSKGQFCKSTLQEYLDPFRDASVIYANTLTTNRSNQGHPVKEGGVAVGLSVNEVELMMGYPINYTACGNLSLQVRRNLLAKAWCLPVLQDLMKPLSEIFRSNNN